MSYSKVYKAESDLTSKKKISGIQIALYVFLILICLYDQLQDYHENEKNILLRNHSCFFDCFIIILKFYFYFLNKFWE